MGRRISISELAHRVITISNDIYNTHLSYQINLSKGKLSTAQEKAIHEKNLKKKLAYYKDELKSIINTSIIDIEYSVNGNNKVLPDGIYKAKLAGVTIEEAKRIIDIFGRTNSLSISILEIKETKTFISEPKL